MTRTTNKGSQNKPSLTAKQAKSYSQTSQVLQPNKPSFTNQTTKQDVLELCQLR
jgi:hypothetical protein